MITLIVLLALIIIVVAAAQRRIDPLVAIALGASIVVIAALLGGLPGLDLRADT